MTTDREEGTAGELTEEQRQQVEKYPGEEEGGFNRYSGWLAVFLTAVAIAARFRRSPAPRPA